MEGEVRALWKDMGKRVKWEDREMTMYAVNYTYSDDTAGRDEHRPAHREFLGDLATDGALVLSGPFPDADPAGALLVFQAASSEEVRELLREDPLQQQGLVEAVEVREWTPVRGRWLPHAEALG